MVRIFMVPNRIAGYIDFVRHEGSNLSGGISELSVVGDQTFSLEEPK